MTRAGTFLVAVALAATGCKRTSDPPPPPPKAQLRSTIAMNDATAAGQLLHGFYQIEENAWRWAATHFSFELASSEAENGARLLIDITLPDTVFADAKEITLTCRGRAPLAPEKYTKPGKYTYERELDPFKGTRLRVTCEVDHKLPASATGTDRRELAIIVQQISLDPR